MKLKFRQKPTFPISISNNKHDKLLDRQISYGVWGKYNRPFMSMNLDKLLENKNWELPKELIKNCQKNIDN